jgi:hypothetical protein
MGHCQASCMSMLGIDATAVSFLAHTMQLLLLFVLVHCAIALFITTKSTSCAVCLQGTTFLSLFDFVDHC